MNVLPLLIAIMVCVTGCSTPLVELREPSFQHKMKNAQHWQRLADDTASAILESAAGSGGRYYIHPPAADMPFAGTFKKMLEESLLASGAAVSRTSAGATIVNFTVDTYVYGPRYNRTPLTSLTPYTTLGAIGWGIAEDDGVEGIGMATGIGMLGAAGPIVDLLSALSEVTNAEVLFQTAIVDRDSVLYQKTEVFYVNKSEIPLYWSRFAQSPPSATGIADASPLNSKVIQVSAK